MQNELTAARAAKDELVRIVCAAMIKEPKMGPNATGPCADIIKHCRTIAAVDPEFILKLALFIRDDVGIRSTANFVTAYASFIPGCQPYLAAYLPAIVKLPSDWLQIASFARDMPMKMSRGLPTSLRHALAQVFPRFNEHTLAKYNKEGAQKAQKKRAASRGDEEVNCPYTLKQMVRQLHISAPAYSVMCLLGKRYPATAEAFAQNMPGDDAHTFDPAKANTRMRLPVPVTWETELASKGNKASVWEALIANKQLPFMATLRNIRNILLAGCNRKAHDAILFRLTNEDQVANSKQFPFRFFSAYEAISFDPATIYKELNEPKKPKPGERESARPTKPKAVPANPPTTALLQEYKDALDKAVKIATALNIRPIHGRTSVLVCVSTSMDREIRAAGAKGIGSVRSYLDVSVLLGLMFKYACESCDVILWADNTRQFEIVQLTEDSILGNMERVMARAKQLQSDVCHKSPKGFPYEYLDSLVFNSTSIDALINIECGPSAHSSQNACDQRGDLPHYLKKLRTFGNPSMLYVAVDVEGQPGQDTERFTDENDVHIAGFSDSILRFVAERGNGGQLQYIERIDEIKGINKEMKSLEITFQTGAGLSDDEEVPRAAIPRGVKPYENLRWFISSTFLDMHSERNCLVREVFPMLRRMCAQRGVRANLVEIDLRWGITAEAAASGVALSTCLSEVERCAPMFIGTIGQRYGYCPPHPYDAVPDSDLPASAFDWLREAPPNMSVTEMEIRHALERNDRDGHGIVLMLRSDKTTATVPPMFRQQFASESPTAHDAVKKLRHFVAEQRHSNATVLKYAAPCDGKNNGVTVGLAMGQFKAKLVKALWEQIIERCPPTEDEETEEDSLSVASLAAPHLNFEATVRDTFVGRDATIRKVLDFIGGNQVNPAQNSSILTVTGTEAAGKSSLMAAVSRVVASTQCYCVSHYFHCGDSSSVTAAYRIAKDLIERFDIDTVSVDFNEDSVLTAIPQIYEEVSRRARVVIILDGLDDCVTPDNLLTLLSVLAPNSAPRSLKVIVTIRERSSFESALKTRRPPPGVVRIADLDLEERQAVLRNHLAANAKKLEESTGRGNQLLPLARKSDGGKAGFLTQMIAYLKAFSTFDTLKKDIRAMPPTFALLQEALVKNLERDHGRDVAETTLSALVLTGPLGGIAERDLGRLNQVGRVRRLLYALGDAIRWDAKHGSVSIQSTLFAAAVKKRYFPMPTRDVQRVHASLLELYLPSDTIMADADWQFMTPRAVLCASYHAFHAKAWPRFESMVTSLGCLQEIVEGCLLPPLLNSIAALPTANRVLSKKLQPISDFLVARRHILVNHPTLLVQAAVNMPSETPLARMAKAIKKPHSFVSWINNEAHGEGSCLQVARVTNQAVLCSVFSPKGNEMAVGGKDWILRVVNVLDGQVRLKLKHPNDVTSVAYVSDTNILTGGDDGTVRLWSAVDGTLLLTGTGHTRRINDIAVEPSGATAVTASDDASLRIWKLKSDGKEQEGRRGGPPRGGKGGRGDGKQLDAYRPLRPHTRPISCAAYHSSGVTIASGSWDGTVYVATKEKGTQHFNKSVRFTVEGNAAVCTLAFLPSLVVTVAAGTYDGKIYLFDAAGEVTSAVLDKHMCCPLTSLNFSPDNKIMVSADATGSVRVWRAGVVGTMLGPLTAHSRRVNRVVYSADSKTIMSVSHDADVRVWNPTPTIEDEVTGRALHTATVTCIAASKDGSFVVTGCADGTAHCIMRDNLLQPHFTMVHATGCTALTVTQDSTRIVSGCRDGDVYVWRNCPGVGGRDGSLVHHFQRAHNAPVSSLTSCGEEHLFSCGWDARLVKYDVAKGTVLSTQQRSKRLGGALEDSCSALAGTSRRVVTVANYDGSLLGIDVNTDRMVWSTQANPEAGWVTALAVSPSGTVQVCGTNVGNLWVNQLSCDGAMESEGKFRTRLTDDTKTDSRPTAVRDVVFMSDTAFAVAAGDGTLRVMAMPSTDRPLRNGNHAFRVLQWFHCTSPLHTVSYAANASMLCCGDALGNVYFTQVMTADNRIWSATSDHAAAALAIEDEDGMPEALSSELMLQDEGRIDSEQIADGMGSRISEGSDFEEDSQYSAGCSYESTEADDPAFELVTARMPRGLPYEARRQFMKDKHAAVRKVTLMAKGGSVKARGALRNYSTSILMAYSNALN